jgi:hypothetical protein
VNFFVGDWLMLHFPRDDDKFAFADNRFVIAELHSQGSFYHQEKLVFVIMMMPDEFAFQFNNLYVAIVHFTDYVGFVVFGEQGKLLLQVDGFHSGGGLLMAAE